MAPPGSGAEGLRVEPLATQHNVSNEAHGQQYFHKATASAALGPNAVGGSTDKASLQWTTAGWLGSTGLLDQVGDALTPPDAIDAQQQYQLKALLSLVPEGEGDKARKLAVREKKVCEKLRNNIDNIAVKIADCILQLCEDHASGAAIVDGVDGKFGEADFELSYAGLSDFHNGLEGIIGPPSVHFMQAMEEKHTREHELNKEFTTSNYGITTTPKTE